jgi:Cys-rich four helix bundle protein (predicted Tat secretion target)
MRRRAVLAGATWLAGATLGAAGSAAAGEHEGHAAGSAGAAGPRYSEAKAFKRRASLVAATNDCVSRGQACLSHCMETFVAGDTTMAECARAVQEMLATCQAFGVLAANDSVALRPMAQACIAVCEECEKQCRVHEDHQPECRECADACAALVREARKVLV